MDSIPELFELTRKNECLDYEELMDVMEREGLSIEHINVLIEMLRDSGVKVRGKGKD